jgi:hypothetical protein
MEILTYAKFKMYCLNKIKYKIVQQNEDLFKGNIF